MKVAFLALGLAGMVALAGFLFRAPWGWAAMVSLAVATLWYLPFGTVSSVVQLVLLMLPALRSR
jgi:hypothetical protein